jgi:hypothetical protein
MLMVEQCRLSFWDVYVRPHHVGWLNDAGYLFGIYMLGPIMLDG